MWKCEQSMDVMVKDVNGQILPDGVERRWAEYFELVLNVENYYHYY